MNAQIRMAAAVAAEIGEVDEQDEHVLGRAIRARVIIQMRVSTLYQQYTFSQSLSALP